MALQHCSSNAERSCASGLQGLTIPNDLPNNCNYSDLCSDGDAIKLAAMLKGSGADDPNLLSRTLRSYYNNPVSLLQRFKAISESVGASDERTAKDKFFAEIDDPLNDITLVFSQTVPMEHTATRGLSLAEKPRRQHVKL